MRGLLPAALVLPLVGCGTLYYSSTVGPGFEPARGAAAVEASYAPLAVSCVPTRLADGKEAVTEAQAQVRDALLRQLREAGVSTVEERTAARGVIVLEQRAFDSEWTSWTHRRVDDDTTVSTPRTHRVETLSFVAFLLLPDHHGGVWTGVVSFDSGSSAEALEHAGAKLAEMLLDGVEVPSSSSLY